MPRCRAHPVWAGRFRRPPLLLMRRLPAPALPSPLPGFQPLIDAANGQPTLLDCDPAAGMCMVAIRDFLIPEIPAACTAAECLVDSYSLEEGKPCSELKFEWAA